MPLSLYALALAAFGIGTTEYIIMGILPDVARDLRVSVPEAGLLVSGYAYGVAFGAPLVAIATAGLPRKAALLAQVGVFRRSARAAAWPRRAGRSWPVAPGGPPAGCRGP